ncbi:phage tail protein [Thermosulfuriphilus sp.]
MARAGQRQDPFLSYRFLVEIAGLIVGGFEEVSGIEATVEIEEIPEGGENQLVYRLPKGAKYGNLVLKRGLISYELWDWFEETLEALNFRKPIPFRTVNVIVLGTQGEEVFRLGCERAWPFKWMAPELKAKEATVAIETLEIAYHGLRRF